MPGIATDAVSVAWENFHGEDSSPDNQAWDQRGRCVADDQRLVYDGEIQKFGIASSAEDLIESIFLNVIYKEFVDHLSCTSSYHIFKSSKNLSNSANSLSRSSISFSKSSTFLVILASPESVSTDWLLTELLES